MFTCICPYCKNETGVGAATLFDKVLISRKTCEQCGQNFLIVNDVTPKRFESWPSNLLAEKPTTLFHGSARRYTVTEQRAWVPMLSGPGREQRFGTFFIPCAGREPTC